MIDSNIKFLRKKAKLTQEELAEKLGVSRQSVAKWENGETVPDVLKCVELAAVFDTSVEALVSFELSGQTVEISQSDGKFIFGIVKVGERGQIVIPKYARDIFNISAGDRLIVLGDIHKGGIALAKIYGNNEMLVME